MKKTVLAIAQLALGIGLVAALLNRINQSSWRILMETDAPVSVESGAVYTDGTLPVPGRYVAELSREDVATVTFLKQGKLERTLPETGMLTLLEGTGPETLAWTAVRAERHGFAQIGAAFRLALTNAHMLAVGILLFGVCLFFCIWRWHLLLKAQGLALPFRRATSLYFVGQFFNSFMPGSVGGDIIKAYFAARRTRHKRTEAVSTIMLDRIVGLLALLALTAAIMAVFLPFFLAHRETRIALAFNLFLLAGAVAGLFVVFRKNLFEHWALFRNLSERTEFGGMINRVYSAFHHCFRHSGLLTRTVALSLGNHLALVFCAYFLSLALATGLSFLDVLKIFPVINAIAAIPVTPGGLGTREGATVFLLGVLGVAPAEAIALSLLLYVTILGWSLVGGAVYCSYLYGADKSLRDDMLSAVEDEDEGRGR